MDDKNRKEKEHLLAWGGRNSKLYQNRIFPSIERDRKSYWIKRKENEEYLEKYGFDTIPELDSRLSAVLGNEDFMKEIQKSVLVACMKNQEPEKLDASGQPHTAKKEERTLPEYIYNF